MATIRIDRQSFPRFAGPLHISEANARETVERPDRTAAIRIEGLELRLFVRKIDVARAPFYLLVLARVDGEATTLLAALKVYPDLRDGAEDLGPLDLLRALAERFGLDVSVAGLPAKFFLIQRVLIGLWQEADLVRVINPGGRPFLGQFFFRVEERPERVAVCAVAFALDAARYVAWAESH